MTCVIDISLLQFGQLSIVGTTEHARLVLMTLPFARQNVEASKRLTLDWVPVSLKSKRIGSVALRQRLDHQVYCAPIIHKSRAKKKQVTTLVVCLATQRNIVDLFRRLGRHCRQDFRSPMVPSAPRMTPAWQDTSSPGALIGMPPGLEPTVARNALR